MRATTLRACEDEEEEFEEAGGDLGIPLCRKRTSAASRARLLLAAARWGVLVIVMIEDNLGIEQEKVEHNERRHGVLRDGEKRTKN